jgi:hypothetical protein
MKIPGITTQHFRHVKSPQIFSALLSWTRDSFPRKQSMTCVQLAYFWEKRGRKGQRCVLDRTFNQNSVRDFYEKIKMAS